MKALAPLALALAAVPALAAAAAPAPRMNVESWKNELIAADAAFSAHSEKHGVAAAFDAFAAEDAVKLAPGAGVIKGRAAIAEANREVPAGFVLTWKPLFADVAASGDLGYTYGSWEGKRSLPDGTVRRSTGHYISIWRRQADGTWKWVLDTGTVDPPPSAAQPSG